ncbi:hypothetical protein Tco_1356368, partial [Tanacetum coccineum]
KALDDALVAPANRLEFGKCNMRLKTDIKPKEATFQVVLDALALTPFYQEFLITAEVSVIYMQDVWATVSVHNFALKFLDKSLKTSHWNMISSLSLEILDTLETSSTSMIHKDNQVYGTILPKDLTNQAMLESKAYKTYCDFTSREKTPKPKYVRKKVDSDTTPKQKHVQATKGTRLKTKAKVAKSNKKKQPSKMPKSKGLDSKVLDEQHLKTTGADEGTGTIPGVSDVPIYESKSEKESWGDSGEEDENDSEDKSDGNDDDEANDDDNQEGDDTNGDDKETDSDRTESDRIKIHVLNQSSTEYYEEEDDEEMIDEEEDDEVTKELYDDVNVNLGNKDTDMTNADQDASEQQNVSQESGFEQVEEDVHVTLTPVLDTQKADEP